MYHTLTYWFASYSDTFSPVAKLTSIRLFISLAVSHRWNLHQLDIKMSFFMGILQKRFIWSNLPGLLLRGRLVEFVVSKNHYMA